MKAVRNLVAAIAAGSALSLGAAAFAQDAKQPEAAKPEAKQDQQTERHPHPHRGEQRGEPRGMQGMHHMHDMQQQGGGCPMGAEQKRS